MHWIIEVYGVTHCWVVFASSYQTGFNPNTLGKSQPHIPISSRNSDKTALAIPIKLFWETNRKCKSCSDRHAVCVVNTCFLPLPRPSILSWAQICVAFHYICQVGGFSARDELWSVKLEASVVRQVTLVLLKENYHDTQNWLKAFSKTSFM